MPSFSSPESASGSDGRVWAAKAARTLARRLRRNYRKEQGHSRARALHHRTQFFRRAIVAHWDLSDMLGGHLPAAGEAVKALTLIKRHIPQELLEDLQAGNWARHARPPSSATLVKDPDGAVSANNLEQFREQLFLDYEADLYFNEGAEQIVGPGGVNPLLGCGSPPTSDTGEMQEESALEAESATDEEAANMAAEVDETSFQVITHSEEDSARKAEPAREAAAEAAACIALCKAAAVEANFHSDGGSLCCSVAQQKLVDMVLAAKFAVMVPVELAAAQQTAAADHGKKQTEKDKEKKQELIFKLRKQLKSIKDPAQRQQKMIAVKSKLEQYAALFPKGACMSENELRELIELDRDFGQKTKPNPKQLEENYEFQHNCDHDEQLVDPLRGWHQHNKNKKDHIQCTLWGCGLVILFMILGLVGNPYYIVDPDRFYFPIHDIQRCLRDRGRDDLFDPGHEVDRGIYEYEDSEDENEEYHDTGDCEALRWPTTRCRMSLRRWGYWPLHRWPPFDEVRPRQSWQRWKGKQRQLAPGIQQYPGGSPLASP